MTIHSILLMKMGHRRNTNKKNADKTSAFSILIHSPPYIQDLAKVKLKLLLLPLPLNLHHHYFSHTRIVSIHPNFVVVCIYHFVFLSYRCFFANTHAGVNHGSFQFHGFGSIIPGALGYPGEGVKTVASSIFLLRAV